MASPTWEGPVSLLLTFTSQPRAPRVVAPQWRGKARRSPDGVRRSARPPTSSARWDSGPRLNVADDRDVMNLRRFVRWKHALDTQFLRGDRLRRPNGCDHREIVQYFITLGKAQRYDGQGAQGFGGFPLGFHVRIGAQRGQ